MSILLWILQAALAVKSGSVAWTHGLRPDPAKMQRGRERLGGGARPLLALAALGAFLGALCLILPSATGTLTWLTPLAAGVLAVMMLAATGFHVVCREQPKVWAGLILFALAAFVAYGRWVLAPL